MGQSPSSSYAPSQAGYNAGPVDRSLVDLHANNMRDCFQRSKAAWNAGNRALAGQLSQEGKRHQVLMQAAQKQVSAAEFSRHNASRKPGELDLHGQSIESAKALVGPFLRQAKQSGRRSVVIIVGRGSHSKDGVAILKPQMLQYIQQQNLQVRVHANRPNEGCITVEFAAPGEETGWFEQGVRALAFGVVRLLRKFFMH